MPFTGNSHSRLDAASRGRLSPALRLGRAAIILAALAACIAAGNPGQQSANPADHGYLIPAANRMPDANDQMQMHDQESKKQSYSAANVERKKQISDDSAKLLKLATELKSEVEKTNKDTLSVGVIRKADEIEKLAHNVKEKMKLTVGGS